MAEALVNHFLAESWQAYSAGIVPAGFVHPLAIRALQEIGIEHIGRSKSVDEFIGGSFDLVVTVCSGAELNCPVWLGSGQKEHIGFLDPAQVIGSEEVQLRAFRKVRDEMLQRIVHSLRFMQ